MGRGVRGSPPSASRRRGRHGRIAPSSLWIALGASEGGRTFGSTDEFRAGPLLDEDGFYIATEAQSQGRVYGDPAARRQRAVHRGVGSVVRRSRLDGDAVYAGTEDGRWRGSARTRSISWRTAPPARTGRAAGTPHGSSWRRRATRSTLLDRGNGTVPRASGAPGAVLATPATAAAGSTGDRQRPDPRRRSGDLTISWDRPPAMPCTAPCHRRRHAVRPRPRWRLWVIPVATPDAATSHTLDIVATAGRRYSRPRAGGERQR